MEDETRCRKDWEKRHQLLKVQLNEISAQRDRATEDAKSRHLASGKRGEFRLEGHTKSTVQAYSGEAMKLARQIEEERIKFEADHGNWQATVKRFGEEITKIEREIEKRKSLVG